MAIQILEGPDLFGGDDVKIPDTVDGTCRDWLAYNQNNPEIIEIDSGL
jgi:hypothetical protein